MTSGPGRLRRLELTAFRSYRSAALDVEASRLIVVGANAAGKSNLLEAAELLGSLRSHRTAADQDLIRFGASCSRIRGLVGREGEDSIALELRQRGGRQATRNGCPVPRQRDLLDSLRCVCFSCLDLELVRGGPALRRQWLDRVVLQLEPIYGDLLSRYGRLLRQRISLLRRHRDQPPVGVLDAYDQQMANLGTRLHRRRYRAVLRLNPLAEQWQRTLSGQREALQMVYRPGTRLDPDAEGWARADGPWLAAMEQQLVEQRQRERCMGSCQVGPQRDEVDLLLNGQPARRYGSAGQQRCVVLALKLAELELVTAVSGQPPLLLLDDVLAELDPQRQQLLLEAVGTQHQCLVTTTHLDRFVAGWQRDAQCVTVTAGEDGSILG